MESGKFYVICLGNNLVESMTKEQILAAIVQAVEGHSIADVDAGFVTMLKEQNKNIGLKFWVGTTAEYNAEQSIDPHCFYILSDDTEYEDLVQQIAQLSAKVDTISALKGQVLLNRTTDNAVAYGDNLSVALEGANSISDFTLVDVWVSGMFQSVLCTVHRIPDTDTYYITGVGNAQNSGTNGVGMAFVNITVTNNTITRQNTVTSSFIENHSVPIGYSIYKIVGIM